MVGIRRAGVVLLIVVLALAVGGGVAGAKKKHKKKKTKHWDSSVTLTQPASTQFAGVVRSKLDACRDSRIATLYYTDPNTGETRPLSVQRTDNHGNYQINLTTPAYAGTYQVIVVEQKIRAMKAPQICKGATSVAVLV